MSRSSPSWCCCKTLLNIEALGRQLDPDLDLWSTAKPFLEKWMLEQMGPQRLWRELRKRRRTTPSCRPSCRALRRYRQRPADHQPAGARGAKRTNRLPWPSFMADWGCAGVACHAANRI